MTQKLLFVVNVDWFFLSHRLRIALEAQRQGFEVHIATRVTDRLDELLSHGLIVHVLALDRTGAGLGNAWLTAAQLWKVIRRVQPDVVHLVTIKPILLGGILSRLMGVPAVVVAVSGLGYVFMSHGSTALVRRRLVSWIYRVALTHPNLKVIFQNADDLRSLRDIVHFPDRSVTLIRGSGVDLEHFVQVPLPGGVPVVLLAARLLADKGVLEFVQAARLLRLRNCSVRFALVGMVDPANPTSITREELDAWVNEGVVEWWGHRSDMSQVLAMARVVTLPSYREGLPKVLLEAAACGRPVVTTDVPGCRDAIDPGVTGILVPVRNSEALADAVEQLIINPDRCQMMGDAGRALAERAFDVQQVVAAHLFIYSGLIEKSRKVLRRFDAGGSQRGVVVPDVTISVVSHYQLNLIKHLLTDLDQHCKDSSFELILTLNMDEPFSLVTDAYSYPIRIIRNASPKGFGANHNQAFTHSTGRYFCVMNPDIRFNCNPFKAMLAGFDVSAVGVVAPLVVDKDGEVEVSARRFPSPQKILCKVFGGCLGPDYLIKNEAIYPDWVGGMFMLFFHDTFGKVNGFDERYFLYYEDVDLCARLRLLGYEVMLSPQTHVIHDAQRSSHGSYKYLRWHVKSMMRFFLSTAYWRLKFPRPS